MSQNFPPYGFIPTTSAVEGIQVFMPAPPEQQSHQEIVAFKCPNCGADQAYSAADQALTCVSCGYREVPQQQIVGKQAEEFEFKVETLQQSAQGWGVERTEMQCENCGATTTVPSDSMTVSCPFCLSAKVVQRKAPQDVLRPRFLIPHQVTTQSCHDSTKTWLGSSWMTPRALTTEAVMDRFVAMYVPFWTFDAETSTNWKAEVGHTRTTGSGKNRRTYTVWRWESGHVDVNHDDVLVSGTTRVSELLLNRANNFSTTALVGYDPKFLAGVSALAYERDLEQAWEIGRQNMRETTRKACYEQMSSSKVRNFSMQVDFNHESWRYILLPIYVATYKFQDQVYQVVVNGQTGRVEGQRPVDWVKVGAVITALFIPFVLTLLAGCMALVTGTQTDVIESSLFLFGGGAAVITFIILRQAMAMDDV